MKKYLLLLIHCLSMQFIWAQWSTADASNNIHNTNTNNVGIGVSSPGAKLEIAPNAFGTFRAGVTGDRAHAFSQFQNSAAVIADNATTNSFIGAVAWDFYNNGTSPSWAGALIQYLGTGTTGNSYGVAAANQGQLIFQNCNNSVIGTNGANLFLSPGNNISTSFLTNGNVGIGTTNATHKLTVNGDMFIPDLDNGASRYLKLASHLIIQSTDNGNNSWLRSILGSNIYWDNPNNRWQTLGGNDFSAIRMEAGGNITFFTRPSAGADYTMTEAQMAAYKQMTITATGSVGIGTDNVGTNKLAVEGTIAARKVLVTATNPFPDYVFKPEYKLPTLDSITSYIKDNGHLPDMPSAATVAKDGLDLGGNQVTLVKKIEELTLYAIQQKKELEELKQQNKKMQDQINKLIQAKR